MSTRTPHRFVAAALCPTVRPLQADRDVAAFERRVLEVGEWHATLGQLVALQRYTETLVELTDRAVA